MVARAFASGYRAAVDVFTAADARLAGAHVEQGENA